MWIIRSIKNNIKKLCGQQNQGRDCPIVLSMAESKPQACPEKLVKVYTIKLYEDLGLFILEKRRFQGDQGDHSLQPPEAAVDK